MERTDRIEEEIKKVVGPFIDQKLKDPRLDGMISVTKVDLSRDFKYCKIFVSMLAVKDKKEALDALKSAAGLVRKEIGNKIRIHSTPEVKFEFDDSLEYGEKIQSIIKELDIKPLEDEEDASDEEEGV